MYSFQSGVRVAGVSIADINESNDSVTSDGVVD